MVRITILCVIFATLLTTQAFAETDATYNAQTGALHIPKVKVAGDTSGAAYRVDMVNRGGWSFGLSSVANAPAPTLSHLAISGETQVSKNGTLQLTALALASDGAWTDVTSSTIWSENSSAVSSVSNGLVKAGYVSTDQQASIRASFSFGSVSMSSTHQVTVSANTLSRLYLQMINADSVALGMDPLLEQPNDGFLFQLGGTTYEITSAKIQGATTYPALIIALEEKLASLGLSDTVSVSLGEVFSAALPPTFEAVTGTTIVLVCNSDETIRPIGFSNVLYDPTVTFFATIF